MDTLNILKTKYNNFVRRVTILMFPLFILTPTLSAIANECYEAPGYDYHNDGVGYADTYENQYKQDYAPSPQESYTNEVMQDTNDSTYFYSDGYYYSKED